MASYEIARDRVINVGDVTFAYRQLGALHGIPLVLLMHFRLVGCHNRPRDGQLTRTGEQWTTGIQRCSIPWLPSDP